MLAALLAPAWVTAVPPDQAPKRSPNVIVIVSDALRADHLGCYGYGRPTSPFLDSLAPQSLVFDHALANSTFTRESVSTLFTGRLPTSSGSTGWGAQPAPGIPTMAELFHAAGYRTALITSTRVLDGRRFARGFDVVERLATKLSNRGLSSLVSERAIRVAEQSSGRPFMMYLHYVDPHAPYEPPEDLLAKMGGQQAATTLSLYGDVRGRCAQLVAEGFGPGEPRFEDMVRRYDGEIADVDRALERLFQGLQASGALDNTVVVVTADHGEEFLEHGFVEHAWTLYQEVLHVPLMVWSKPGLAPARSGSWVSLVDLLPTLLDVAGVGHDRLDLDGASFLRRTPDGLLLEPADRPVIAELLIPRRSMVRAVIDNQWKYISAQMWLPPEARPPAVAAAREFADRAVAVDLWRAPVREELYDLGSDPGEKVNLAQERSDKRQELSALVERYHQSCRARSGDLGAHSAPEKLSPEEEEALRALGYLE